MRMLGMKRGNITCEVEGKGGDGSMNTMMVLEG